MNLRIHSWPSLQNLPEVSSGQRPEATAPNNPTPTRSTELQISQSSRPEGVTQEEWTWIQRHFPSSEKLTLRLYGPNRTLQTLRPGALGTQLDVKG